LLPRSIGTTANRSGSDLAAGSTLANLHFGECLDKPNYDYKICSETFYKEFEKGVAGHWYVAALFAFVPIPIAWLIAFGLVAVVRWIRRGFAKPQ
jgi:hypothetical protein